MRQVLEAPARRITRIDRMDESCPCHCHDVWPRILAHVDAVCSAARLRIACGGFCGESQQMSVSLNSSQHTGPKARNRLPALTLMRTE